MKIDDMAKAAHQNAIDRGWHDGNPRSFGELIALAHSELSEALEAFRARGFARWTREDGKPEGVMSELADVIIRLGDTSELLRREGLVDQFLGEAIAQKMAYNLTRPYRHGGKLL